MEVRIDSSWKEILGAEFDKEYFVRLTEFVRAEYGRRTVYPPASKIFPLKRIWYLFVQID